MYAFFLGRVRDRLHVVLCFSPVGGHFSRRAQQFPGLINGCTIDWVLAWPEEALTAVSSKAIDDLPMACPALARGPTALGWHRLSVWERAPPARGHAAQPFLLNLNNAFRDASQTS